MKTSNGRLTKNTRDQLNKLHLRVLQEPIKLFGFPESCARLQLLEVTPEFCANLPVVVDVLFEATRIEIRAACSSTRMACCIPLVLANC